MSWTTAALFGGAVLLAGSYVLHVYRKREPGASGTGVLALLRVGALALVLLLLLDPTLPAASPLGGSGTWLLVDGSGSMAVPAGSRTVWSEALRRARDEGSGRVLLFGDDPRPLEALDSTDAPPFAATRLVPALERAAESGARRVRIVSDLRMEDGERARTVADRLGLEVVVEALGGDVRSAGVATLEFEDPLEAEETVAAQVTVFVVGASPTDSVTVEVREEGRLVASRVVPAPAEGRLERIEIELPAPEEDGEVRYTARAVIGDDAFPGDDERVAYADVDPEEGNLVLLSTEPDWELRFLVPVLQRVTGLPARAFLQVGPDRYLAMDPGGAGGTEDRDAVEALVAGAEILVVQTADVSAPWVEEALVAARRSVVLARGAAAARAAGVTVGSPRPGEWYASGEIPPSPLAGELAGVDPSGLPPLADLLPLSSDPAPGPVPLTLRLGGTRDAAAALVLLTRPDEGRSAVALASGFWRWAFREDVGRDAYERLWSGVAGWLLADEPLARGPGVRPEERVVPGPGPLRWTASGLAGEEVELRLLREDTTAPPAEPRAVLDTVLTVPETGRFRVAAPEPGTYRWEASRAGGSEPDSTPAREGWEGRLDVEAWTGDLRHPRDTLLARAGGGGEGASGDGGGPGRHLRTHPLPYLLVLVLLSAEWIGRRRKGLR